MYMPIKKIKEGHMNIFFYIIIFLMGITFGSFYTLAVYRIPKGEDITHKHSYCPNCNNKLKFIDLIPIFSYLFLKGKCRYCNQKIRPRYLIIETMSGLFFVLIAYLMGLNIESLQLNKVIEFIFFILYFTFIVLTAGINKEIENISEPMINYGSIISIMYIVYLYIIETTSIYRYAIYLIILLLVLAIYKVNKKINKNSSESLLMIAFIMIITIFTGEYITICSLLTLLILLFIFYIYDKIFTAKENKKAEFNMIKNKKILYISIFNIIYIIFNI